MSPGWRGWVGPAVLALVVAVGLNASLSLLSVQHDVALVALLTVAAVAVTVLALSALDSAVRIGWTVRRSDARPGSGEDTRTAMYRHVIEVHLTSQDADDAIMWQIADLARHRLRQQHGIRYEESPLEAAALVGPVLAEWISRDRRHRYASEAPRRRYSVAELGAVVHRIEEL